MNGKVLLTLQYDEWPSDLTEVYDPTSGSFSDTGTMTQARMSSSTSTLLSDGKVLVAGRDLVSVGGSADLYDAVTGKFLSTGVPTQREEGYASTLLPDGTVLLSAGWLCCGYSVDTAVIFRPSVVAPAPRLLSQSGDGHGQGAILHAGTGQMGLGRQPGQCRRGARSVLHGFGRWRRHSAPSSDWRPYGGGALVRQDSWLRRAE